MGMKLFSLFFVSALYLSSCSQGGSGEGNSDIPCSSGVDLLVTDLEDHYFDFDERTNEGIDLDQDGKDDFQFTTRQSGNRTARILSGRTPGNQVTEQPFLDSGTPIDSNTIFVPEFHLNGMDRDLDNDYGTLAGKYFGLRMDLDGESHFGWIRFSTTDSTPGAPLYYSNLSLTLHSHAFNQSCGGITASGK